MSAASRRDDAHLAFGHRSIVQDDALVVVQKLQAVAVSQDDSLDHFVDKLIRLVDDLSHAVLL